ncbi:mitochondrial import inner membrane translocase subunit Tim10B [Malaya genurostris]|uniref:mitochondrial import inner membrane translocase subunit Tim10B n=1 Tax=Malaya genurostris TaxID=325434 RepID=UPI0026F3FBCF|nr:mitochondrial import inner membrane translocase subunit Tim10B [Malaya genurostris]
MDFELRNLKDFLGLYNKVTELCFNSCVDNFFDRDLTKEEIHCTESCVGKFTNVNQRLMQVYVGVQSQINERRMVEFEAQQQKLIEQQQQQESQLASGAENTETIKDAGTKEVVVNQE